MNRGVATLITIFIMSMAVPAGAEQSKQFGEYTVHYSAFTTDILSPIVAEKYDIRRSKNRALLNISILKKVMGTTGKPVKAKIEASATNLSSQLRQLKIRELTEPGAIYYLAETSVNDGETLKFTLHITPEEGESSYSFTFYQQFATN